MRNKAENRSESVGSKICDSASCHGFLGVKQKLLELRFVIFLLSVRDKASGHLLKGLLAFFAFVGPVWNFFFIKTLKPDKRKNGIIPDLFPDEPNQNGPTSTKSQCSKII